MATQIEKDIFNEGFIEACTGNGDAEVAGSII
jgi:hypothetical protein